MNEYYFQNPLKNTWSDMITFLKEFSEWDEDSKKILNTAEEISKEKNITLEDSLFIILYGNTKINDLEFLRRLN